MQTLIYLLITIFISGFVNATSPQERLQELEERIAKLEQQMQLKLETCQMTYKHYGTYLNSCPQNTFIQRILLVSHTGQAQVDCGYYQLQCFRKDLN